MKWILKILLIKKITKVIKRKIKPTIKLIKKKRIKKWKIKRK
jgi:hypothetical protein